MTVFSATVGDTVNAADLNTWMQPLAAYKSSDTGRTSTTLSDDPDLSLTLAANSVYQIFACLAYVNSASGQIKGGWTIPTGSSMSTVMPKPSASGSNLMKTYTVFGSDTWTADATTSPNACETVGLIVTGGSSGTLAVQWCANSSSGTTTMQKGSHLMAYLLDQ